MNIAVAEKKRVFCTKIKRKALANVELERDPLSLNTVTKSCASGHSVFLYSSIFCHRAQIRTLKYGIRYYAISNSSIFEYDYFKWQLFHIDGSIFIRNKSR